MPLRSRILLLLLAVLGIGPTARAADGGLGTAISVRGHVAAGSGDLHRGTEPDLGYGGTLQYRWSPRGRWLGLRLTVDRTTLDLETFDQEEFDGGTRRFEGDVTSTRIGLHALLDAGGFAVGNRRATMYTSVGLGVVLANTKTYRVVEPDASATEEIDQRREVAEELLLVAAGFGVLLPVTEHFALDVAVGMDIGFAAGVFQLWATSPEDSDPSALFVASFAISNTF